MASIVAARHIDFAVENNCDRLPRDGVGEIAIHGDDARDARRLARGSDQHFIANADDAGGNGAGEAAEIEIGTVHPLDGEAHRLAGAIGRNLDGFEIGHELGAVVPGRRSALGEDVVAFERRDRNRDECFETKCFRELAYSASIVSNTCWL